MNKFEIRIRRMGTKRQKMYKKVETVKQEFSKQSFYTVAYCYMHSLTLMIDNYLS